MEPQWSPCKAFSLTDIETIVVWSVSFSIIWQRHWERIGKILSSNCKHVLKVGVNIKGFACMKFLFSYTRQVLDGFVNYLLKRILILGEVFIQQDKWLDCITIVNWRELPILLNSNWNCQENIESVFWGKKFKIHNSWFPKLCLHFFFVNGFTLVKNGLVEEWTCLLLPTETVKKIVNLFVKKLRRVDFQSCDIRSFCEGVLCWSVMGDSYLIQTAFTCLWMQLH